MFIAGIDYSLCGPAICIFDMTACPVFDFRHCSLFFLTDTKKLEGLHLQNIRGELFEEYDHECQRYDTIADWALSKVVGCHRVALEGYAYGAKGRGVYQIAENAGLLKYKLWQAQIPIDIVPPTEMKKFATSKGNSDKEAMESVFFKETKIDLKTVLTPDRKNLGSPVTDVIDAFYLCRFIHDRLWKENTISIEDSEG